MPRLLPFFALALLALCGCRSPYERASFCPAPGVLDQAATVTKLRPGGGKDPTDVIFAAEAKVPRVRCDFDEEEGTVDYDVIVAFRATRGPAAVQTPAKVTYFLALLDPAGGVVGKQTFTHDLEFDERGIASFDEDIDDQSFKIAKDKKPYDYELLVGFQLTPEELAYNREQHRFVP